MLLVALNAALSGATQLIDLNAENWDEVLTQHPLVLVHFFAPWDRTSVQFAAVHQQVADAEKANVRHAEDRIVHARSDVTDQRGPTPYLTEWGVTRLPTIVMLRSHPPRDRVASDGAKENCAGFGERCALARGGGCSCSFVLPHDGRPSDFLPTAATVQAFASNFTRNGRSPRPSPGRRLHLDHEGIYALPEDAEGRFRTGFQNAGRGTSGLQAPNDPYDNADHPGTWGQGWFHVGSSDGSSAHASSWQAGLGQSGDCHRDAQGRCQDCSLDTRPGANVVFPSGWDNPDTSSGNNLATANRPGCQDCGD